MTANVIYAYKTVAYDSTTIEKMHWRCSCGGDGVHIPGDRVRCPSCGQLLKIPEEPVDLRDSSPELCAGVEQQPSTAWQLAAYRNELFACGFSLNDVRELVLTAARNATELHVGSLFLTRAEPPEPIVQIENHDD